MTAVLVMDDAASEVPVLISGPVDVLSPSQVRTFMDCQARWYFRYRRHLPDPPTGSLALGRAVHAALCENFRQKIETAEDLPVTGVVALYRLAWHEEAERTEFRDDEDAAEIGKSGESLVTKYMDEIAPFLQPTAVEVAVEGEIAGVPVQGVVDLIDEEGQIIDLKTRSRRPTAIPPADVFQVTTYRQLLPAATDLVWIDSLIRTKSVQVVRHSRQLIPDDFRATNTLYPLARQAMRSGTYMPNRLSLYCSRRHCPFWRECEQEFGGHVPEP